MKYKFKDQIWDSKMGPIPPSVHVEILKMISTGYISYSTAKKVLDAMMKQWGKKVAT